jgi:hypothetical protein
MKYIQSNFYNIIQNSSIYYSIATALNTFFEHKLETLKQDSSTSTPVQNDDNGLKQKFKDKELFQGNDFIELKKNEIINFILKTYEDINNLKRIISTKDPNERINRVAELIENRFDKEVLELSAMESQKQDFIRNSDVKRVAGAIFGSKQLLFRSKLENIDKIIDNYDGIDINELQQQLQVELPEILINGHMIAFDMKELPPSQKTHTTIDNAIAKAKREVEILEAKKEKLPAPPQSNS